MSPPARIASSSSDRADCERAIGVSSCSRKEHAENHTGGLLAARRQGSSETGLKSHHSEGHSC